MDEPNDLFCSLDLLAEVASRTLRNDPTLTAEMHFQPADSSNQSSVSNGAFISTKSSSKVNNSSPRRSPNSSDKLTLDQIKGLSEKNLIEWFSEHICDEMKKNYYFQCYLIPEKCSQTFRSFGSETRARFKMKAHLLNHIKDLSDGVNVARSSDEFFAEPLHIRKKRLKEVTRKNTRKKNQTKTLGGRHRKDSNTYDYFPDDIDNVNHFETDDQTVSEAGNHATLDSATNVDFDNWSSAYNTFVNENKHDYIDDESVEYDYLPNSSDNGEFADNDQLVLTGHSYKRSKHEKSSKNRKKSFDQHELSSGYTGFLPYLDCDVKSGIDLFHHDHTYSLQVKDCHASPTEESPKTSFKMYRESSSSGARKLFHQCLPKEYPLIIPTPPFPFVYVPVLPHIARIQEFSFNFNSPGKWKPPDFSEGLCYRCYVKPNLVKSLPKNECLKNSVEVIPTVDSAAD